MNRTVKKIALILIILILLPGLFFTVYEINSLNESEKVIEAIYNNQLDAVLFSVNQYSEDIASGWRSSLNTILSDEGSHPSDFITKIDSFLNINNSIKNIFFIDSINAANISAASLTNSHDNVQNILRNSEEKIRRLFTYQRGGYYKIEPLPEAANDSTALLAALINDPLKLKNICVIIIDPEKFVRNVLSRKLDGISGEEFIITCTNKKNNRLIYSTYNLDSQEIKQKKDLWLIPHYELGILLRGTSIESIIQNRTTTSLIIILILTVILIGGILVVIRNIRREVELAQIKSDFVSNVSHELRTPLALISMFAETLELGRARSEEKKQEYYTIISKEAGRLSRIVNKILSFSKIEAGKREYHFSVVDLNNAVEEVFSTYQFHLQNSGFKFSLMNDNPVPEIRADKEAITEAVINLIDNAVKYSRDRKEIYISTGAEKNNVFVEVSDKGIGISDDDQKKIFDKFFRVSEGLVHNTKGTGLGLTLVKHIVDAHNGEIKIKSKPGEGSSFKILFPLN